MKTSKEVVDLEMDATDTEFEKYNVQTCHKVQYIWRIWDDNDIKPVGT
nr:hypothetical protein MACL_00000440 [Theileria orientalis]